MSYLTRTADAAPAAGTTPCGIGVPGFAHPLLAPAEWAGLLRGAGGSAPPREPERGGGRAPLGAGPLHWAVLDVSNGPGSRPDPHCLPAAVRLRDAGVRLLGHLDTGRGTRPFAELLSDARRHLEWYRTDGFWLDRAPTDRAHLPATRRLTDALRALCDGPLVLGHGGHPHPGYAETADQLVTFAGSWADYRWSQVAEWTAEHPPERFCHLVHSVPRGHLDEALRIARWQGAGTVYVTDRRAAAGAGVPDGAWESLPGYWDELVSRIGTGVSE
ncbi:spherulation-specific family 4 protein [Streptomyces angustmyceticus]|uniref:spherulation-specific family 4 protein n=1 Tax=Streptomyces angustmyceticus TaxID=285578 RepID=UPI0036983381